MAMTVSSSPVWAECSSCDNCAPPFIGFTSKQMSVNGTQNLTVSSEAGGPYTWAILNGGGSLSGTTGSSVIYTAPSLNQNCLNNPTIRVTDSCGHTATLGISVNQYASGGAAYKYNYCDVTRDWVCLPLCYGSGMREDVLIIFWERSYGCTGSFLGSGFASNCETFCNF
jgi:hypothetical protein